MSEKRNINLTIADIPLNLNISAADEEIIRKAAKEINERVLKYKTGNTEPEPFYFSHLVFNVSTKKALQALPHAGKAFAKPLVVSTTGSSSENFLINT